MERLYINSKFLLPLFGQPDQFLWTLLVFLL